LSLLVVAVVAATTAGGLHGALRDVGRTVVEVIGREVGEPGVARSVIESNELGSNDQVAAPADLSDVTTASAASPVSVNNADVLDDTPQVPDAGVAAPLAAPAPSEPSGVDQVAAPAAISGTLATSRDKDGVALGSARAETDSLETPAVESSTTTTSTTTTSTTTTAAPTTTTTAQPDLAPTVLAESSTSTSTTTTSTTTSTTTTSTTSTTTTSTTTTTAAPAPSGPGCKNDCRNVGFQDLRGKNGATLENLVISNPNGRCIDLTNAKNVTIRNVTIRDCGTNKAVSSAYDTGLIHIENAQNITIESSLIDNMSNERFGGERNNAIQIRSSSGITVKNNSIRNIRSNIGDKSDDRGNRAIKVEERVSNISINGNNFYNAGRNAVQITRVRDASGISITNNVIEGRGRWDSDYEDMINLYSASGTSSSPIRIANNTLRNGGPSSSGTGMILGDGSDGTGATRYVLVENNKLIDPGHVGINLAGGDHITIRNNTIVGRGNVPLKTTTGFSINDYGYTGGCRDHVVTGNRVWMDNQHLPGGTNHVWNPGTCVKNNRIEGNTFGDSSLK